MFYLKYVWRVGLGGGYLTISCSLSPTSLTVVASTPQFAFVTPRPDPHRWSWSSLPHPVPSECSAISLLVRASLSWSFFSVPKYVACYCKRTTGESFVLDPETKI